MVLIAPQGNASWLKIDAGLVRQAGPSGMLLHFNALFEGIAINPQGNQSGWRQSASAVAC